jgi:hypothetical protein
MNRWIATALFLTLGWFVATSSAEEVEWRPASARKAQSQQSSSTQKSTWVPAAPAAPIVSFNQPLPLHSSATQAEPPADSSSPTLIRVKATDELRPMPIGSPGPIIRTENDKRDKVEEIPVNPNPVQSAKPPVDGSFFSNNIDSCDGDFCHDQCQDPCCGLLSNCFNCTPYRGRLYFSAEYLNWQTRRQNTPPLLTTSPAGTPPDQAGILGLPTTSTLYDRMNTPGPSHSGARFTLGVWLPWNDRWAWENSWFFLGQQNNNFAATSNGDPILVRPFTDANTGQPSNLLTAYPGIVSGSFNATASSYLWGVESNLRRKWLCGPCWYIDQLIGYRHLQLQDSINITDIENPVMGISQSLQDSFATRNQFNGGQVGLDGQWNFWRRWYIGATIKVALGDMRQSVNIAGSSNNPLPPAGGFLALSSNIGHASRDRFAVVPEANIRLGYNINQHWKFFVGYNFLYVSSVVRAGDQIDTTVNPALLPGGSGQGPQRPANPFRSTDFWAQGVNFGLIYTW